MAGRKITVNVFDSSSWERAVHELEKYQEELDQKCEEFLKRVAERIVTVANDNFAKAEYAGYNDTNVTASAITKSGDAYSVTILAEGQSVLFIEFGTGITHQGSALEGEERASIIEGNVSGRGEYGLRRGANPKGWFYRGDLGKNAPVGTEVSYKRSNLIHTYGNGANASLYSAVLQIEHNELDKIAKEVFK